MVWVARLVLFDQSLSVSLRVEALHVETCSVCVLANDDPLHVVSLALFGRSRDIGADE